MRIRIITTDIDFAEKYGSDTMDVSIGEGVSTVVTVPNREVERTTFNGHEFVVFNMHSVARTLPRDHADPYMMVPAWRVVK